jgi:hypothetical protein
MKKTENFIHLLCTPLVVDMGKVAVIERRTDPNKLCLRFETGWSIEVEPASTGDITRKEAVDQVIDRWSGRWRYPDMIEAWSDAQGPTEGYGHAWVDLSACVTFTTYFGPFGRMMEVRSSENHASIAYWLRSRDDISQEEQSAELLLRWRRARGERV